VILMYDGSWSGCSPAPPALMRGRSTPGRVRTDRSASARALCKRHERRGLRRKMYRRTRSHLGSQQITKDDSCRRLSRQFDDLSDPSDQRPSGQVWGSNFTAIALGRENQDARDKPHQPGMNEPGLPDQERCVHTRTQVSDGPGNQRNIAISSSSYHQDSRFGSSTTKETSDRTRPVMCPGARRGDPRRSRWPFVRSAQRASDDLRFDVPQPTRQPSRDSVRRGDASSGNCCPGGHDPRREAPIGRGDVYR